MSSASPDHVALHLQQWCVRCHNSHPERRCSETRRQASLERRAGIKGADVLREAGRRKHRNATTAGSGVRSAASARPTEGRPRFARTASSARFERSGNLENASGEAASQASRESPATGARQGLLPTWMRFRPLRSSLNGYHRLRARLEEDRTAVTRGVQRARRKLSVSDDRLDDHVLLREPRTFRVPDPLVPNDSVLCQHAQVTTDLPFVASEFARETPYRLDLPLPGGLDDLPATGRCSSSIVSRIGTSTTIPTMGRIAVKRSLPTLSDPDRRERHTNSDGK